MNSRERIECVLNLEKPDRTPVAPLIDHFAAKYSGLSASDFMTDGKKRLEAVLKVNREIGPWDLVFLGETANLDLIKMGVPIDVSIGEDTHQFVEGEYLEVSEYKALMDNHPLMWMRKLLAKKHKQFAGFSGLLRVARTFQEIRDHSRKVKRDGFEPAIGFVSAGPFFEYASMGRGLENFCYDLLERKHEIMKAGRRYTEFMTRFSINLARHVGTPRIFIGLSRSSGSFISSQDFEEMVLPDLEGIVRDYIDAGMTPLLHCDSNWTERLHYFRRFPEKKCILELDGATDIRVAKEVLGNRMAIMGDVPSTLLAFGSKDDTVGYCRRLIEDVGYDGGFILSSGCSVPPNAKPENVRAMLEVAEDYKYAN